MTTAHALQTIAEILISVLLIYGVINEEKLIAFEDRTAKKIKRFLKR